jgi:hypothetical protein
LSDRTRAGERVERRKNEPRTARDAAQKLNDAYLLRERESRITGFEFLDPCGEILV